MSARDLFMSARGSKLAKRKVGGGAASTLFPGAGVATYADKVTVGALVHTRTEPAILSATPTAADIASGCLVNSGSVGAISALPTAAAIASALGICLPQTYFDLVVDNSSSSVALASVSGAADNSINTSSISSLAAGTVRTIRIIFTTFSARSGARVKAVLESLSSSNDSSLLSAKFVDTPDSGDTLTLGASSSSVSRAAQVVVAANGGLVVRHRKVFSDDEDVDGSLILGSRASETSVIGHLRLITNMNVSPVVFPSAALSYPSLVISSQTIDVPNFAILPPDYSNATLFVLRNDDIGNVKIWIPNNEVESNNYTRMRIVLAGDSVVESSSSVQIKFYSTEFIDLIPTGEVTDSNTLTALNTDTNWWSCALGHIASADNSGGATTLENPKHTIEFVKSETLIASRAGDFVQLECDGTHWLVSGCMTKSGSIKFLPNS
jgi:hypothetical protein